MLENQTWLRGIEYFSITKEEEKTVQNNTKQNNVMQSKYKTVTK